MNEWQYPTESGRCFVGDYDTLEEALDACKEEYELEEENFIDINNGEIYREACGMTNNSNLISTGYVLNSSPDETRNMFFRSVIIEREI